MNYSLLTSILLMSAVVPVEAIELKVSTGFTGEASELLDGKNSNGIRFRGHKKAPVKVDIVLSLDRPEKLDYIELVSNSPNKWCSIKGYALYADAAGNQFEEIKKGSWYSRGNDNKGKIFTEKIALTGRKVKTLLLMINRSHQYLYMHLSEIKIVNTDGKVIKGKVEVVPYKVEKRKKEIGNDSISQPVVDRYGQFLNQSWPGKVTSDQQLRDELKKETDLLKKVKINPDKYDKFCGIKKYQLKATGFFRVEQWRGKWWFVTPEGHPYIMNGPGAVNPDEWGYGTPVFRGKDKNVSRKHLFKELPDRAKMPKSYSHSEKRGLRVNFHVANLYRKYGKDFEKKYAEMTYKRLISWGFNCYGKWTSVGMFFKYGFKLPYITGLSIRTENKIKWAVDPFAGETLETVKKGVARAQKRDKDNPWLIGYFFWSESGWNRAIVKTLIEDDKYTAVPAAIEFRKFLAADLKKKYGNDIEKYQTRLGTKLKAPDEIVNPANKLKWTKYMDSVAGDFIRYAGKVFFGMVRREYDKVGGKHLLLGSALTPCWRNDIEWSEGGAQFLDVVSIDYYGHDMKHVLRYANATKRPVINIEFNFSLKDRGMRNFHAGYVKTRQEKGIAYSRMLENCVANKYVIGFNYFVMFDQPVTGRSCSDEGKWGERYNTGFVNSADQPYTAFLKDVRKTNEKLFDIHLGAEKPVDYFDWKYKKTIWHN